MRRARIPTLFLIALLAGTGFAAPAAHKPKPAKVAKPAPADTAALKAVALEIRAQARGQFRAFYAERGFWPLWAATGKIGPAADRLIADLESADLDGLKASSYDIEDVRQSVSAARSGDPKAVAAAELALSRTFARYVADVRRPSDVRMIWLDKALEPRKLSASTVLRAASIPASFADYVSAMGWMNPHYVRLRALFAEMRDADADADTRDRLRLNLDRARLLPGPWTRHIVVDAAAARLYYYQGGTLQGTMRVVVGTPETQTPMLAGMVRYAILNPYWNVPVDLAQKRVAPKILAGATLQSLHYEALSDWTASARKLDPSEIDWPAIASGAQEIRLRQLPGGGNAMGRVKFMFPNDQGIYLHDTPDKALLAQDERHLSNGCVRLEDAPRLGKWLLGKPIAAVSKRPEQDVALATPVPVYLTYLTATEVEGRLAFLQDIYARDGN